MTPLARTIWTYGLACEGNLEFGKRKKPSVFPCDKPQKSLL
jgi:hypothetical protein